MYKGRGTTLSITADTVAWIGGHPVYRSSDLAFLEGGWLIKLLSAEYSFWDSMNKGGESGRKPVLKIGCKKLQKLRK